MQKMADSAGDAAAMSDAFELPEFVKAGHEKLTDAICLAAASINNPDHAGLPVRIREIMAVVVLAHMGYPNISTHMRRALAAGATIRELTEALMVISTPGGQRCLAFGLPYLTELVEELGEQALELPSKPSAARTKRGLSVSGDWPWLDKNFPEYQACRRELSQLAFVPQSPALQTKYREILIAVVLSCRRYFTVQEHVNRAIEEGATLEELVDAYYVGSLFGGASVFSHAVPFLNEVHKEIEAGRLKPR
jgi:alkylhydroperoxidase/carboxymuconolactone decarboxylase family protein YurZ